ncbi:O-antigen ligase family protein [Enterovibrio paralichthyis]|uniref:O-antigen ligase family protein n=1 Tax=Enterovibrio paralichthyis TaxID=2853805 RepID=UPI001C437088|nr:O-antigen ligase family protein [Enterovibrio paralichthyis]MBV7298647.1 O-antigen ligase family protein [Enterovibrio paralichthyis]
MIAGSNVIKKEFRSFLMVLFLISPLIALFGVIFNFSDTKWIMSRLIPLVSIYCVIFHRESVKENISLGEVRPLLLISGCIFLYFSLAHLLRGDNFSLPRTLFTSVLYVIVVPWRLIPKSVIKYLIAFASITAGLNALYEFYVMGVERPGVAVNAIPYALYCSLLSLVCIAFAIKGRHDSLGLFLLMGFVMSTVALILTEVRGVILAYPFVVTFMVLRLIPSSKKNHIKTTCIAFVIIFVLASLFHGSIEDRYNQTLIELRAINDGNLSSNIGVRLNLWQYGLMAAGDDLVFGAGDEKLQKVIQSIPNPGAVFQPHLHNQFIDAYARYGLIGMLLILSWLITALLRLNEHNKLAFDSDPLVVAIVVMVGLAGLTDVPFHHTHVVYFFIILISILKIFESIRE